MAVFKSKKTYIKRYASNSIDKKLTFSNEIRATFNSSQKLNLASPVQKDIAPVKKAEYKSTLAKNHSDIREIKINPPKKEFAAKKEPLKQPVTVSVKDAAADIKKPLSDSPVKEEFKKADTQKPDAKEDTNLLAENQKAEKASLISEKAMAKEEKIAKKQEDKILKDKENKKKAIPELKEINKKEKHVKREKPKGRFSAKVLAKAALLIIVLSGCGYFGYEIYQQELQKMSALNEALSIQYAPEDYIYPEPSKEIADKNALSREAAYNEAMQNAYVPSNGEVPNLYKYDYVKTCYLTFDDGPSGPVTDQILDTLKSYNIPATFFVVGKNADAYPDQIRRMAAEGHSIGNHSYSHDYEYMYSGDPQFDEEMNRCKNAIDNILGKKYENLLYRFPGGSFEIYKSFYIYNIQSEGYQYVDWNSLTGDAENQNPDREYIMNTLKESTQNGTKEDIVVLLHDAGAKQITADTLSEVIEYLKSKNYVFKAITNSNYTP